MRKITDEGCLFLYGAGLLVTAETGIPAVIAILFVCIYTCVNLVGEEKYLHYIMTIAFMAAGIISKEMWMFLPVVLYNKHLFFQPVIFPERRRLTGHDYTTTPYINRRIKA